MAAHYTKMVPGHMPGHMPDADSDDQNEVAAAESGEGPQ